MAKGKNLNPAEAYRKAQKKRQIKKNKADRATAREAAEASASKTAEANATRRDDERRQKRDEARSAGQRKELYGPDGRLREPERSVYYDPVLNPFGAPPPGMPMRLKDEAGPSGAGEEEDESEEDSDEEDDGITMPEGPPPPRPPTPDADGSDSDDSDDIPLPPGPPPPKIPTGPRSTLPARPPGPPGMPQRLAPFPRPPPPPPQHGLPSRPQFLPPPPGFDPRPSGHPFPPPPIGAFPGAQMSSGPSAPPLPAAPPAPAPGASVAKASAVISAGPQLRDFKKEATAFVPAAIRKKQREQGRKTDLAGIGAVDTAPHSLAEGDVDGEVLDEETIKAPAPRPNLMDTLRSGGLLQAPQKGTAQSLGEDDYARFVASVGDML